MKWFNRRAPHPGAREGGRAPLSRGLGGAGSVRWGDGVPASYEAQLRDGYGGNAVARRAVRLIAESIGGVALRASDPRIAALLRARSAGQPLLETAAAQLLLHGNAYLQILCDEGGEVCELFALRPERVAVELDADGWPAAYRYAVPGSGQGGGGLRLDAGPIRPGVVHLRNFNPFDDHYGLGNLGAAASAVALANAAARWNKALLDNAARPSGALVYDPGDGASLSPDQFERLRAEMEGAFSGAANAGRPMLLEGGLRWQAMGLSPADMDFAGLREGAAREIALAFGVPPMLLGLPGDATYANYREANKALWRLTVLPLAAAMLGGIGDALAGWFEDASVEIDLDRVPALAEDRELLWRSVGEASFLSDRQKRAMLNIPEEDAS